MSVIITDNRIQATINRLDRRLTRVLDTAAEQVLSRAQVAIQTGPKTGRTYRKSAVKRTVKAGGKRAGQFAAMGLEQIEGGKSGKATFITGYKIHRASAPGQAPATDTGNLVNSGYMVAPDNLTREIGFTAEYAQELEEGSADGRVAPRPFLRPALDAVRPSFERAVAAVLEEL